MRSVPRFYPEVEDEVIAVRAWYDRKRPKLGEEFQLAFKAALQELLRYPYLSSERERGLRRRLLRRFPYAIYYTIRGREIIVCGFFHCARDPAAIQRGLTSARPG